MAKEVVAQRGISIRLACQVFTVSESCYRYEAKLNAENEQIADWLLRLACSELDVLLPHKQRRKHCACEADVGTRQPYPGF